MQKTFIALLSILSFTAISHTALAENIYHIPKVDVYVEDPDPSKARLRAMSDAEQKAFDQLQERLVQQKIIRTKKRLPPSEITSAVDSMDVVNEKFAGTGYRAQLNVAFNPNEVSRLLSIGIIPTTNVETEPNRYLVIPIVLEKDKVRLWKHQWWETWNNYKKDTIILPVRDLQDVKDLGDEDLIRSNLSGLQNMADRYGANNIVLIQADYIADRNALEVQLERIKGQQKTVVNYEYPGDTRVSGKDLYSAAANDIVYRLEHDALTDTNLGSDEPAQSEGLLMGDDPQSPPQAHGSAPNTADLPPLPGSAPQGSPPGVIGQPGNSTAATGAVASPVFGSGGGLSYSEVYVTAPDLLAWNRMRTRIIATPGVQDMQIKSFTAGRAYITVGHNNNLHDLKNALERQGFQVISVGDKLEVMER